MISFFVYLKNTYTSILMMSSTQTLLHFLDYLVLGLFFLVT